jgi:hypothetical protein
MRVAFRASVVAGALAATLAVSGCGRSSLIGFDDGCPRGTSCQPTDGGFNPDGFNPDGFSGDGFNPDGFLGDGFNPDGPHEDGFITDGFILDGPTTDARDGFVLDGGGDLGRTDGGCAIFENCKNGIDDNCNGLIDCKDPFCAGSKDCVRPGQEICNNNIDDNDNGLIDCADPECFNSPFCLVFPDLGGADLSQVDLSQKDAATDGGKDAGMDLGPVDLALPPDLMPPLCDPINPNCADPRCKDNPKCIVLACMPEIDFGVIAPMDAKVTRVFDTTSATRTFSTCAFPGGTALVGQFTLTTTASVRLDFTQQMGAAHVVDVFRAGTLQACDANPLFCLQAGQAPSATHSFAGLAPGVYYVIVQSYPGTQGATTVTLSTASSTKPEICNNGVDDDGNGLIDCADPACFTSPICIGTECNPDINLGALVVGAPGIPVSFDTHTGMNRYHPTCAGTSTGNDRVVRFTLKETAGILVQWNQSGNHVFGLFTEAASGLACDALQSSCYPTEGGGGGTVAFSPRAPGQYVFIFKSTDPSTEGVLNLVISSYKNSGQEICNNGIDDDGNGLIDCQDPACLGVPGCTAPLCLFDINLGDFSWGTQKMVTLDTTTGTDYYKTTCARGSGKEKIIRLRLTQPMALGFNCTETGSHVLQLGAQLQPLDPCDAHEFNCADPSILPFGCNFAMPNIQPGLYNIIVAAFQAGEEGVVNLTLTGIQENIAEICDNGIDDDKDGFTDCADKKCVTSPLCVKFQCRPDQKLGVLPLTGATTTTVVQTSMSGSDQTIPCVTTQGGNDEVVDFQLPAKADLTIMWAQAGNHDFSLFTNDSDLLACDAGTRVSCTSSMGMPTGTISLPGVAQGKYHLIVKADKPGSEGGVVLQIAGLPSP